jgi:hypothetical protein
MKHIEKSIEIISWKDARESVLRVNPELAQAIDESQPKASHKLIKVKYPYGAEIIKKGMFFIPSGKGLTEFSKASSELQKLLDYSWMSVPLGIVTKGAIESFWLSNDSVIPQGILEEGATCAKRTIFSNVKFNFKSIWNLTAGARTLFLLPSIKDREGYARLAKYFQIPSIIPRTYFDQWFVFKDLALKNFPEHNWYSEMIFFTRPWVEEIILNKGSPLGSYLHNSFLNNSEFLRNEHVFNFIWHNFLNTVNAKRVIVDSYLYEYSKYLVKAGMGASLAFSPDFTDRVAPIEFLSRVYVDIYSLKQQPIFMKTSKNKWGEEGNSLYLSLQLPIHYQNKPCRGKRSTGVESLKSISDILDIFKQKLNSDKNLIKGSILESFNNCIDYKYYHKDKTSHPEISSSNLILDNNKEFTPLGPYSALEKPYYNVFFKGCINIKCLNKTPIT